MRPRSLLSVLFSAVLALWIIAPCADAQTPQPQTAPAAASSQAAPPADHIDTGAGAVAPTRHGHPRHVTALESTKTSEAVRIALILTLLTLIPAIGICMTPFIRIVVVLSMIRHAFGMPETPPNQLLISLALFLTAFVMGPTLTKVNSDALQPYLSDTITTQEALDRGSGPLRDFMLRQVHDQDIKTVYEIAHKPLPAKAADVGVMELAPAFMLNELRVSFKIGFVIFLPFLLIDLVVSSILLSLGMLMVPPSTLSLPIKVLMFVLIDGWSLVLQGVVGSFR
jgi:flagellar biosynthesis protein FliP